MNSWKVILATMVIFGAGVVTGGLVVRYSQLLRPHRSPHPAAQRSVQPVSAGGTRLEFLRRAQRELDLTAEQREQADKLISESQERIKKLWEPITPKVHEDLRKTKEAFRELLTPEQRARFDELLKQQQQRPRDQRRSALPSREHPPESLLTNTSPATNP